MLNTDCLIVISRLFIYIVLIFACGANVLARTVPDLSRYEGRTIASVEVVLEGVPRDSGTETELRALLTVAPNTQFAAVRVRESLQALFDSNRVANARVEAFEPNGGAAGNASAPPVGLRFVVRPQVRVNAVAFDLGATPAAVVSTGELRARLNLLAPGTRVSEQALRTNADAIQTYLRDRGFYRADVSYTQAVDAAGTGALITFKINPGEQARIRAFNIAIKGYDPANVRSSLVLTPGAPFTRSALGEDIGRIRQAIIAQGFLAPQLDEPREVLDSDNNTISITLTGGVGPKVNVVLRGYELGDKKARELLPVKREGSIDVSAIVEGARRLRNRLQENGYFFAEVDPSCSVDAAASPPTNANATATSNPKDTSTAAEAALDNDMLATCENLNPQELSGHTVNVTYDVERGRRFKLTAIRIEGTNKLSYETVADDLRSQTSNVLGFIPLLGYGRGYTSLELLAQDQHTIEARMHDLGYRQAKAEVRQGVSLNSENLIITFNVTEGPLTRVSSIEIRGNELYTSARLRDEPCAAARLLSQPCTVIGAPYSRSLTRTDADRIRDLYARNGYIDAKVDVSITELPKNSSGDEQVRLVYTVTEGGKVFIHRIIVNGNEGVASGAHMLTKREAILEAIPLREGDVLRADKIAESERILYETNAFRQVIIRTEPAMETASGFRTSDVIIDLEELKPRRLDYGGGYSTDGGPLGLFEIQNNNLFGKLQQGALRLRANRLHQLIRLEFLDPRLRAYGKGQFSPLAVSAQYQRDVSVTRFFRTTIDRGNFGIVQRLDAKGNPIDQLGQRTGQPTINRFTFNIESQRVLNQRSRTIIFARYNYEDVRLFNLNSLLLAPILRPDKAVRLSRFGVTLARDTRDSQFDPTRGEFLTVDYALALRQLGGNLSFNKLQTTYRRYYKLGARARDTVLAFGANFGAANLFNPRDRDGIPGISDVDKTLPISERFFSGGSTTLRGFGFEEAGPRIAVCPNGEIRSGNDTRPCNGVILFDNNGKPVAVNPFLVPVGGNALAVVNVEARVPLKKAFQIVPFYDGGNVFRRIGDIFGRNIKPGDDPNLRAQWTHTVGFGFRFKTPLGPLAIDYGYLLNPPEFLLPQGTLPQAIIRPKRSQIHFRFGQTF